MGKYKIAEVTTTFGQEEGAVLRNSVAEKTSHSLGELFSGVGGGFQKAVKQA
ncbi:MAG: hypothetical protein HC888_16535 [Candidatus Competibacteraceae bacterium]|nr:hypothetical protein [Candidatus Competibacteraceae bacterium]